MVSKDVRDGSLAKRLAGTGQKQTLGRVKVDNIREKIFVYDGKSRNVSYSEVCFKVANAIRDTSLLFLYAKMGNDLRIKILQVHSRIDQIESSGVM